MASGTQSPRQKMINLMYLVFIAMLALNMSKEVLTAFGLMNEKLTESNATTAQRNNAFLAGLDEKVGEQPAKYAPLKEKADKIDVLSEDFNSYLENLKTELLADVDDKQQYEEMDKSNKLDEMFFQSGRISPKGQEFLDKMNGYKNGVVSIIGNEKGFEKIIQNVQAEFSTESVKVDGANVEWLKYRYEGFPLVASITQLTQTQADIKSTESEILSAMLSGQLQSEVSLTNYEAIVVPSKT
ncbi:MAG TPA: gliding motility protein GldM, partial [Gillisia sp.]|nr:gliding motility protein GldM [Gillisia sp.]